MTLSMLDTFCMFWGIIASLSTLFLLWSIPEGWAIEAEERRSELRRMRVIVRPAPASPVAFARTMGTLPKGEKVASFFRYASTVAPRKIFQNNNNVTIRDFDALPAPTPKVPSAVNVRRERDAMRSASLNAGMDRVLARIEAKRADLDAARKASDEMIAKARAMVARRVQRAGWSDGLIVLPVSSKRAGEAAMACGNVAMRRELKGEDSNGRKVYSYTLIY